MLHSTDPAVVEQDKTNVLQKLDLMSNQQLETNQLLETMLTNIFKEQQKTNKFLEKLCTRNAI